LACLTGLRSGEIAGLHLSNLQIKKNWGIITIDQSYEYKQKIFKKLKQKNQDWFVFQFL
jgi:integrase